jgi:transketolase
MIKLSIQELEKKAVEVRRDVLKMIYSAGSGHPAGSLSVTDILVTLYFQIMNHDPKKPLWPERDRFILSNGHTCPALYAVLAEAGYFPKTKLKSLRRIESPLQGHPERKRLPGMETSSGPLGEGLAQAIGMALAANLDQARFRVFCLTSDAEHQEGSHWEAVAVAAKYKLPNLTLFVDRNQIEISGPTEEVMPLQPLKEKYQAFNWNVLEIDGHNFEEIIKAVETARAYYDGPTVIIAQTIAGKGVSFMENDFHWHGKAPNKEEIEQALEELK